MAFSSSFFQQWKKPAGLPGRVLAALFNASHAKGLAWGLSHVQIGASWTILDVGCGGGAAVRSMARLANRGAVTGIDYSPESVAVAARTNAGLIRAGRVDIRPGSVSCLEFPDETFDLATAINSHYYWPNLEGDLREVRRVLKPGGWFLIIGESYKGSKFDARDAALFRSLHLPRHSPEELSDLVTAAGFEKTEHWEQFEKGWICLLARKSGLPSGTEPD